MFGKFRRSRRGQVTALAAAVIIGAIIATAFAMIIGAVVLGETYDVATTLNLGTDANATIEGMYDVICRTPHAGFGLSRHYSFYRCRFLSLSAPQLWRLSVC